MSGATKKIFLEPIAIFNSEIIVCVGATFKNFEEWINKTKLSKSFKKDYKDIKPQIEKGFKILKETSLGCMICLKNKEGICYFLLLLRTWGFEMSSYDVLLHEVIHYKQFQWEAKTIGAEEIEFEAYFIENVFLQLRNSLNKLYKL